MFSTLFYVPAAPVLTTPDGDVPSHRYRVVGRNANGVYCHGEPGAPIPKGVRILANGQSPWTWNGIATQFAVDAEDLTPHEWAGEPTARHLVIAPFTKEAARRAVVGPDIR